jgi:hypothetical protein
LWGDKWINLSLIVLIVCEAFEHLGAFEAGQTPDHFIHSGAGLDHRNNIMNPNSRPFYNGVARSDAWHLHDVTIVGGNHFSNVLASCW